MTAAQRELDIVLYGATGFVGKLTAEYLARSGGRPASGSQGAPPNACSRCANHSAMRRGTGR
jgi:hypothetical protein